MKNKLGYIENIKNVGNFTKVAVENFEENIVNKVNYLESINKNILERNSKFEEDKNE